MNDDKNKEIMEAYYKYIADSHVQNIADEKIDNDLDFPDTLDKWFEKYHSSVVNKKRKEEKIKKIKKVSLRAAAILVAVFVTFSVVTFSVEAVRVKVLNYVIDINEKYINIGVKEKNNDENENTLNNANVLEQIGFDNYYYPKYLPQGYIFEGSREFGSSKYLFFNNYQDGEITFIQTEHEANFQINTDDKEIVELSILGNDALFVEGEETSKLVWNNHDASFSLTSNLSREEMVKFAENIEKIN